MYLAHKIINYGQCSVAVCGCRASHIYHMVLLLVQQTFIVCSSYMRSYTEPCLTSDSSFVHHANPCNISKPVCGPPAHAHSLVPYSPSSTLMIVVTVVHVRVVGQTLVVSHGNHPSPGLYPSKITAVQPAAPPSLSVMTRSPRGFYDVGRGVRLLDTMMRNGTSPTYIFRDFGRTDGNVSQLPHTTRTTPFLPPPLYSAISDVRSTYIRILSLVNLSNIMILRVCLRRQLPTSFHSPAFGHSNECKRPSH
ncbi:hypothetical protein EDB83DRAFT_2395517 [Lactarius deliciosus]|nr:hypothetical protein EDB83DRAFT_2395517 [Lactarius deliciosus]